MRSGVDKGVLYPKNAPGVNWNGLISVTESPTVDDVIIGYYDGQPYAQEQSNAGFSAAITAFSYPDALDDEGIFGFCYRTELDSGYELHLIYNAIFSAKTTTYASATQDPEAALFTWTVNTYPIQIPGIKACSHFVINSTRTYAVVLAALEALLYGTDSVDPRFPTPGEVLDLFEVNAIFRIIDNGDGTWTAIGPDSWIQMLDSTTFQITSPSATFIDADTYRISSW